MKENTTLERLNMYEAKSFEFTTDQIPYYGRHYLCAVSQALISFFPSVEGTVRRPLFIPLEYFSKHSLG